MRPIAWADQALISLISKLFARATGSPELEGHYEKTAQTQPSRRQVRCLSPRIQNYEISIGRELRGCIEHFEKTDQDGGEAQRPNKPKTSKENG
jgi:hypothetical protein